MSRLISSATSEKGLALEGSNLGNPHQNIAKARLKRSADGVFRQREGDLGDLLVDQLAARHRSERNILEGQPLILDDVLEIRAAVELGAGGVCGALSVKRTCSTVRFSGVPNLSPLTSS